MIEAADLNGHWRRDWIRAPDVEDRTTRVDWVQAPTGYADLRIRADQPDVQGAVLADLAAGDLLALMLSEGFAGTIVVERGVCTWTRRINWHGAPQGADVGRLMWQGHQLIEAGVHADYTELWSRADPSVPVCSVFTQDGWDLHLVTTGAEFVLGIGDPLAASSTGLRDALKRGERPEAALARQFRGLFGRGEWDGSQAVVLAATCPALVGTTLFDRSALGDGTLTTRRADYFGNPLMEVWRA